MRMFVAGMIAVASLGAATRPAVAQGVVPFGVVGRVGAGFPTGDFGEDLSAGVGFEADVILRVLPHLNIYGGWSRSSFERQVASEGSDVIDSGPRVGAQVTVPVGTVTRFVPFVSAGILFSRARLEGTGGRSSRESATLDQNVGYDVGAGLSVPIAPGLSVVPAVRYRAHDVVFGDAGVLGVGANDVSYFSADVGLKLGL